MEHKAGYAAIIGLPNAGKSTLLNCLLGQKLSIVTHKPQTTRRRITGILSEPDYQIVFLDTPGILDPEYLLQEKMMEWVKFSLSDADVVILMIDAQDDPAGDKLLSNNLVKRFITEHQVPVILVLNKIDLIPQNDVSELIDNFNQKKMFNSVIPLSALLGFNRESLINSILAYLPQHPKYYDEDIVSDEYERFFIAEIIREKIFELYSDEIPYSSEVEIEEFKEREGDKDYIRAAVLVERASQKGILIGKGGEAIKKLGQASRSAIKEFHGKDIYLELFVKVAEKWRSNERMIKQFGYKLPESED